MQTAGQRRIDHTARFAHLSCHLAVALVLDECRALTKQKGRSLGRVFALV